jgi:hypothetical protein
MGTTGLPGQSEREGETRAIQKSWKSWYLQMRFCSKEHVVKGRTGLPENYTLQFGMDGLPLHFFFLVWNGVSGGGYGQQNQTDQFSFVYLHFSMVWGYLMYPSIVGGGNAWA